VNPATFDPEAAFVGAVLHSSAATALEALALVVGDDFADQRLSVVAAVCRDLAAHGVPSDPIVVLTHIRAESIVTGADALRSLSLLLADLYAAVPVPASVKYYAAGVLDAALRRRCAEMTTRLGQAADRESTESLTDLVQAEVAVAAVHARLDTATAVTA
jgi:replicative DNA helicase